MRPLLSLITLISLNTTPAFAKLEVHEWGTFTSLVGSNGQTQNGMYHEDEVLPDFVHPFGYVTPPLRSPTAPLPPARPCPRFSKFCMDQEFMDSQVVTQKMETPVLYFRSDREQDVTVNVKFPKGVITETYPGPIATSPVGDSVTALVNGDTTFKVRVQDPSVLYDKIPGVDATNIYAHARNVQANFVRNGNEVEKFIFYRGIGQYQPDFDILSSGGNLSIFGLAPHTPQIAFLIDVNAAGDARLVKIRASEMRVFGGRYFSDQQIARLRNHSGTANRVNDFGAVLTGEAVTNEIVNGLVQSGLHLDEAKAMVATWERGYLKVPGLRLLAVLPRADVETILPLTVTPTPDSLERVFVSRIEILLDTEEQQILSEVKAKGDEFDIGTLGRFAEPKLRRVREVCQSSDCAPFGGDVKLNFVFNALIKKASDLNVQPGQTTVQ